jgi:hypothetical protein
MIVRSLAQKLSWQPDFTVAKPARHQYNISARGLKEELATSKWEELMKSLLGGIPRESFVIFVIDGLDQCADSAYADLLTFMAEVLAAAKNVCFLCSSRQHVPVKRLLGEIPIYEVNIRDETKEDMETFIKKEIASRKPDTFKEGDSVFCMFCSIGSLCRAN